MASLKLAKSKHLTQLCTSICSSIYGGHIIKKLAVLQALAHKHTEGSTHLNRDRAGENNSLSYVLNWAVASMQSTRHHAPIARPMHLIVSATGLNIVLAKFVKYGTR